MAEVGESIVAPFEERAAQSGLDFVHFNGMSGEFYYSEMMGSGAALVDYDRDGDLDVYLVQGHMLPLDGDLNRSVFPPLAAMLPVQDRLYRNDLHSEAAGTTRLVFTDVTTQSGIRSPGYGMGVAVGDINNDGWPDLYVTNKGPNQMFLNNGDGTFSKVTDQSMTQDLGWGASSTFFDLDRDGWLDLYVTNYVEYSIASHKLCRALSGAPDYCAPIAYRPQKDRLFRNRGNGIFEDLSGRSNILSEIGAGLGVVAGDWNADGWTDLYVANDGMANFLWVNLGDGTFRDDALLAGCAVNMEGRPEAGMGVTTGDFDADGDEDLLLTHIVQETNTLYRNDGSGSFEDYSVAAGIGTPSWSMTAFGTDWIDFDNDGWSDILAVSGAVRVIPEQVAAGSPYPLTMPNLLLRNLGQGRFADVSATAPEIFGVREVSRGVATGDVDNDGDVDAVVVNNSGPVRLLINQVGEASSWVGVEILSGSDQIYRPGARIEVIRSAPPLLMRRSHTDGSYLSARDPRVVLGLGDSAAETEPVRISWPSGREAQLSVPTQHYTTIAEGDGQIGSAGSNDP